MFVSISCQAASQPVGVLLPQALPKNVNIRILILLAIFLLLLGMESSVTEGVELGERIHIKLFYGS